MSLERPTIAVVGAGALGSYYGAMLTRRGYDVHLLMRSDAAHVREHGLRVRSCAGDFELPAGRVRAYDDPAAMPPADLVVVTIKTTDNDQLPRLIAPLLKPDTAILTLQNGLGNEELLAGHFGPERVLGGVAFICVNRVGPGAVHHIDHGRIMLGEFGGGPGARAARVCSLFEDAGVSCGVLASLVRGRWDKLVWNVPFNGLGAALDATTGELISTGAGLDLVRTLMREVVAAAAGLGVSFAPDLIEQKIAHTRTMGAYYTSMQIDARQGRPMEVEAVIGRPLEAAATQGIATPTWETLHRILLWRQSRQNGKPG